MWVVSSRVVPGTQAVQPLAPVASLVSRPLGHRVQVLAAYMEGRKRRAAHLVQPKAPVPLTVAPLVGAVSVIWPAGQALQTFMPTLLAKKALGQGVHSAVLGSPLYWPRRHSVQVEAPGSVLPVSHPAGQVRHLLSVAPGGFQVPTLHLTQKDTPEPSGLTVISPGGQSVQVGLKTPSE